MSIEHKGYKFICSGPCTDVTRGILEVKAGTRRTAIRKAREKDWFVGIVRVTVGLPKSKIRSVRRELCPCCKWIVGAY
jgi:hypothetical protein